VIFVDKPRTAPAAFKPVSRSELAEILAHFSGRSQRRRKFEFKAYRHKVVKAELERLFNGKCAYCEWRYGGGSYFEVDHYRPKKHYYWLAAEWANLLPACKRCNNGKLSVFPLADPKRQARAKGEERREKPLLLNPSDKRIRPGDHLCFDPSDGAIRPAIDGRGRASKLGETSIGVYRLARTELSLERKEWALRVRDKIQMCRRAEQMNSQAAREEAYQGLKALIEKNQPFRALTIEILRANGVSGR
jgi:uncharacterized protein (TIGR02646 family)